MRYNFTHVKRLEMAKNVLILYKSVSGFRIDRMIRINRAKQIPS